MTYSISDNAEQLPWPKSVTHQLIGAGILLLPQLVRLARTSEGLDGLVRLTNVGPKQWREWIDHVLALVPEEVCQTTPPPVELARLGFLLTREMCDHDPREEE
ncbi:MAG: hypothetical protein HN742_18945 [Lentisphaerae bacterium]|jgi:hypothetical protein|nr:hypothetical protein [Lentisphaerota bacterium]MBT5607633.1 hypothetical protein [Lentisphaerota bacterium]MBT7058239.1 hypothetical protein [Lentisphaerota bacterium]MBT7843964.1 hypothetical protein [Lentisphaerota bacterium]